MPTRRSAKRGTAVVLAILLTTTLTASAGQREHSDASGTVRLSLDGHSLGWPDILRVLRAKSVHIQLSGPARKKMADARAGALRTINSGKRVYGWNQALGPLKDKTLDVGQQREFQRRVLRSHSTGVGKPLSPELARLALVLRVNSMARGTMGVRPAVAERALSLVNAGITPRMPGVGSLGIGDLQPMAAAGLTMEGKTNPANYHGTQGAPAATLRKAGLPTHFRFEAGEALALISGTSVVAAKLAAAIAHAQRSIDAFDGAFAMFLEATRAEKNAFDPRTHAERGIPEETAAAHRIRALTCGSGWMTETGRKQAGETDPRVQDAVSVRAEPHTLGVLSKTLAGARRAVQREANSGSSNPLVFPDKNGHYTFVEGGNWDAAGLGHQADNLNAQITDLGKLSEQLSGRLLNANWSYGLPDSLAGGTPGLNTGMSETEPVAAALVSEMQTSTTPAGTHSHSTMGGQEDHTSMAMTSARNLTKNLNRLDTVLGIQSMLGAQGMDLIRPKMGKYRPATNSERIHRRMRTHIKKLNNDRYLGHDIHTAAALVRNGSLSGTVHKTDRAGCGDG